MLFSTLAYPCAHKKKISLAKKPGREGFSLREKSEPTIHVLLHLLAKKSTFVKETGAWVFRRLPEIKGRAWEIKMKDTK